MRVNICHISTVHTRHDIRIFVKQARTLASMPDFEVTYLVADGLADEHIDGVNIVSISKPKSRIDRMLNSGINIVRRAQKLNADIYHIHDPELFWAVLVLKKKGKKVILDLHEDLPMQILSKPYLNSTLQKVFSNCAKVYEGFLFPRATAIITATPFIADIHKRSNTNIVCISNYPLKDEFKEYVYKDVNDTEVNGFCYTGGITAIRGIKELLQCVLDYEGDWVLHLAGPISDSEIKALIDNATKIKPERIKYWGVVSRSEMGKIFQLSIAGFVTFHPVPNHINAVPNKMFEYMSAGLPIICSAFENWVELVEDQGVGLTVNPQSSSEINDAVTSLLNDKEKARILGDNGKEAVSNVYNWENEAVKLIDIYKKIL